MYYNKICLKYSENTALLKEISTISSFILPTEEFYWSPEDLLTGAFWMLNK